MSYEKLENEGYDFSQINQILKAQEKGINFDKINKTIPANIMREIIRLAPSNLDEDRIRLLATCLKQGFDTTYVLDMKYNTKQAEQIVDGMYKKIDYKAYANPDYTVNKMRNIKKALILGLDSEIIKALNPSQLKKYLPLATKCAKQGFDIKPSILEGYNCSQVEVLLNAHNCKINLKEYVNPEYDEYQMKAILNMIQANLKYKDEDKININPIINKIHSASTMGILYKLAVKGIDITELSSGKYVKGQINVIKEAIISNKNYKILLNPKLSAEQMNIILNGLKMDLDVNIYAKKEFSPPIMKALFDNLKYNKLNPENQIDVSLLAHTELTYNEILKYAKILKAGTLDEKLEVIKRHNDIIKKDIKVNIEKER